MNPDDPKPFTFDVSEDYEQRIEDARAVLEKLPRDENWENAQRVLADPPSREAVEAAQREAAQAMAMLAEFQQARHTGYDPDQTTKVVIDAAGELRELEFSVDAVRLGNHGLADAIGLAWADAEDARAENQGAYATRAGATGGGSTPAEQVLADIESAVAAREHERFEASTEDGLSKLAVNLRGRLTDVVFLQNNVLNLTDRHTLAEQLTAALRRAQSEAAAVVGDIGAVYYARLG
ncbi:YbaB/EbfC family nucleoid-associated protein [Glycomyces luteolus]|uniref:YbaB/EbfC family nucleoid-associated protein n=1 Tax=Glycomyces luteolus TaxID=2670330 RepID=A0A9X3T4Z8_9ACTN|nr:YbaB/EbfC family nucleoid-associated protein [Glycomyces luteolus]MDA1361690.1 YbaB/EbfC family nucleoid-associated protein [Glycomyces luteolus]